MQDRENFMDPDPKVGWIHSKDEPVPCCKICESSHYPNLDYSNSIETRTPPAFIQINNPYEEDIGKKLEKFVTSTSKSKTDRIMSENAKRTRKLRKMMKKKAEGGGKGARIPYLDSHHCNRIPEGKSKGNDDMCYVSSRTPIEFLFSILVHQVSRSHE